MQYLQEGEGDEILRQEKVLTLLEIDEIQELVCIDCKDFEEFAAEEYHCIGCKQKKPFSAFQALETNTFFGAGLLNRLRVLKKDHGTDDTRTLTTKKHVGYQRPADKFRVSFEDAYGYRGNDASVYYLSPWVFTARWTLECEKPPSSYTSNAKTMWTQAGLLYKEVLKNDKKAPAPKAGEHYIVVDCKDPARYISFPKSSETEILRHHAVMVRWKRPHVPQPSATPLPTTHLSEAERGRIFSVYLRPCTIRFSTCASSGRYRYPRI